MPASTTSVLISGNQISRRDAPTPHLSLKGLYEPLHSVLDVTANRGKVRALPFGYQREKAAMSECALHRKMDHIVWDDALLRATDRLNLMPIALDNKVIILPATFRECKQHVHSPVR